MATAGEAVTQGWITADEARVLASLAVAVSALWLAADLRWGGWVNDALTRLVIELGAAEPSTVQDMLRVALDDDRLVLGYALEGGAGFVDEHGEAIVLPGPSSGHETVPLISGGEKIGVLVRGARLRHGCASWRLALRLLPPSRSGMPGCYAAVNRQVADVSASRRRLVAAVEAQRVLLQGDVADRVAPKLADVARAIPETHRA